MIHSTHCATCMCIHMYGQYTWPRVGHSVHSYSKCPSKCGGKLELCPCAGQCVGMMKCHTIGRQQGCEVAWSATQQKNQSPISENVFIHLLCNSMCNNTQWNWYDRGWLHPKKTMIRSNKRQLETSDFDCIPLIVGLDTRDDFVGFNICFISLYLCHMKQWHETMTCTTSCTSFPSPPPTSRSW